VTADAQREEPKCEARIHDGSLPSHTAQIRRCRNDAAPGARFCCAHLRPWDEGYRQRGGSPRDDRGRAPGPA
jgi:hypothetical protein